MIEEVRRSELYNRLDLVGGLAFMGQDSEIGAQVEALKSQALDNRWDEIEEKLPSLEAAVGVGVEGVPPVAPSEPIPPITEHEIFYALVFQDRFRHLSQHEHRAFAGAPSDAKIWCRDDGWIVFAYIDPDDRKIAFQAICDDGCWMLRLGGTWEKIGC